MENIKDKLKKIVDSKNFNSIIYGFVVVVVVLLIFQAGVFVGFHKASFSYKWGDSYQKFFEMRGGRKNSGYENIFGSDGGSKKGDKGGFLGRMGMMDNFIGSHGVTGKIIDIKLPSIVMTGEDNTEKAVLLNKDTIIRQQRGDIKPEELKLGDNLVVVGVPNDNAEIVAKMIRVIPAILEINSATSTNK